MMWFFILLGIAIVVTFVVLGYRAAVKAANEPDATNAHEEADSDQKRRP